MASVTFVQSDGSVIEAEIKPGLSLMRHAVDNMVDEILAECGGSCSCATCHVYVDDPWKDVVGPAGDMEMELIETLDNARSNSRLSCQINVTLAMQGLTVHVAEQQ